MQNTKFSLVIPAYNEAGIIEKTIEKTLFYLSREFSDYELIIADDGSTDKTRQIAGGIADDHLHVVSHYPNRGKGSAVRDGVLASTGEVIAYTDADLAYGLEAVGELAKRLTGDGTDAAIGSRKLHPDGYADYPAIRLAASRCFSFATGLLAGFQYDTQCGLKAFRREPALQIFSRCEIDGFAFDFEVMMLCGALGYSVTQLPVKIINHRESKVNVFKDSFKMLWDVMKIRGSVKERLKEERGNGSD